MVPARAVRCAVRRLHAAGASLAVTGPAVSPVGSRALHGTRNYKSGTACRLSRRRGSDSPPSEHPHMPPIERSVGALGPVRDYRLSDVLSGGAAESMLEVAETHGSGFVVAPTGCSREDHMVEYEHEQQARQEAAAHPVGGDGVAQLRDRCVQKAAELGEVGVRGHTVSFSPRRGRSRPACPAAFPERAASAGVKSWTSASGCAVGRCRRLTCSRPALYGDGDRRLRAAPLP